MKVYYVRITYFNYASEYSFGPFESRAAAENCLVELSKREDVKAAHLEEEEKDDE